MDCAVCYIVKIDEIVDSGVKVAKYGSSKDTIMLRKCRKINKVVGTQAHKDAAFGWHATGILADYYIGDILRNNLGSPQPILDFTTGCSVEESKALGSGYNVSYFICIY